MMDPSVPKFYSLMAYSHWSEPRPGQDQEQTWLYDTVWKLYPLHLNQNRGRDLLSPIVLVPVPVPVSVAVLLSVNTL